MYIFIILCFIHIVYKFNFCCRSINKQPNGIAFCLSTNVLEVCFCQRPIFLCCLINIHYIHSVLVQDFVSGRACCVNQYHYESLSRRVVMQFGEWTATNNNMTSCTKCSIHQSIVQILIRTLYFV
jgi:hypothetical protein